MDVCNDYHDYHDTTIITVKITDDMIIIGNNIIMITITAQPTTQRKYSEKWLPRIPGTLESQVQWNQ